eukprot:796509-Pelagomonas_calceolata.AAC.2
MAMKFCRACQDSRSHPLCVHKELLGKSYQPSYKDHKGLPYSAILWLICAGCIDLSFEVKAHHESNKVSVLEPDKKTVKVLSDMMSTQQRNWHQAIKDETEEAPYQ